jgi:hypothetical protein
MLPATAPAPAVSMTVRRIERRDGGADQVLNISSIAFSVDEDRMTAPQVRVL